MSDVEYETFFTDWPSQNSFLMNWAFIGKTEISITIKEMPKKSGLKNSRNYLTPFCILTPQNNFYEGIPAPGSQFGLISWGHPGVVMLGIDWGIT